MRPATSRVVLLALSLAAFVTSIGAAEADAAIPADCAMGKAPVDYARKADLPAGVAEARGFPMAEADEPFQATDVIRTPRLPFQRFVSARRTGCVLRLRYQRGGIALRREDVNLDLKKGKWTVRKPAPKP